MGWILILAGILAGGVTAFARAGKSPPLTSSTCLGTVTQIYWLSGLFYMSSWGIFAHSVKLVFRNMKHALPISTPVIVVAIAQHVLGGPAMTANPTATNVFVGMEAVGPSLAFALAQYIAAVWSAVAWHRFVLLEEYPTAILPRWNGSQMLRYALMALGLGLILLALGGVIGLLVMGLAASLGSGGIAVVLAAGLAMYLGVLWLRMAAVLPSRAIGETLSIGDAIQATRGASLTFLGLIVLFVAASVGLLLVILPLFLALPLVGILVGVFIQWVSWMVSISTLTTIHGVYIEGRSIE